MGASNKEAPGGAPTPQGPDQEECLLIESSVAHPHPVHTGEPLNGHTHTADEARYSRSVAIATNHLREIKKLSTGCYSVPASKSSEAYVVTVRPVEACSCPDSLYSGHRCKHRHAVLYMLKKTGICEGCGVRHFNRDLFEVVDSLTFFAGDLVCRTCADNTASETV